MQVMKVADPADVVAVLGRRGGRPLPEGTPPSSPTALRCGPRPSRRTAAATGGHDLVVRDCVVAILGRRGGRPLPRLFGPPLYTPCSCDPRPSRRTAAATCSVTYRARSLLRSSAVAEDGRCTHYPTSATPRDSLLRSS